MGSGAWTGAPGVSRWGCTPTRRQPGEITQAQRRSPGHPPAAASAHATGQDPAHTFGPGCRPTRRPPVADTSPTPVIQNPHFCAFQPRPPIARRRALNRQGASSRSVGRAAPVSAGVAAARSSDNPRRDPRHLACRHGCGRDRGNAQDVCHHRADRDGRIRRRVARGQAPGRGSRGAAAARCRPLRGGTRPGRGLRATGWAACRAAD